MATIREIENAVSNFTSQELARFRAWFEEFDAAIWDRQFEEDVKAGKLDAIADKLSTKRQLIAPKKHERN